MYLPADLLDKLFILIATAAHCIWLTTHTSKRGMLVFPRHQCGFVWKWPSESHLKCHHLTYCPFCVLSFMQLFIHLCMLLDGVETYIHCGQHAVQFLHLSVIHKWHCLATSIVWSQNSSAAALWLTQECWLRIVVWIEVVVTNTDYMWMHFQWYGGFSTTQHILVVEFSSFTFSWALMTRKLS